MFFIGFPVPSYALTTSLKHWIYQTTYQLGQQNLLSFFIQVSQCLIWVKYATHQKKLVFKNFFPFKVRKHSKEQVNLLYKAYRILYKMVGAPSFLLTQLFHATNPAIPANIFFLYLRQFSHPYSLTKPSVQSPPTTPSSIPQSFFAPLFLHTAIPTIPNKNPFSYRNHSANSGCTMSLMSKWVLCGLTLISCCSDSRN